MQNKQETKVVVKTQQESTKVFTVEPKVERKVGDEFTVDDKQVVVVEVNGDQYHVKNKVAPFDSFWI